MPLVDNKITPTTKGAIMKMQEDSWAAFALTGDPKAYLNYKQRKEKSFVISNLADQDQKRVL